MNDLYNRNIYELDKLNLSAKKEPQKIVEEAELFYTRFITNLALNLTSGKRNIKIIMISGPSSSGKTTTAKMISERLKNYNRKTKLISLDDFYRGEGMAPMLPDGKFDYESVEALNIAQVQNCLLDLMQLGYCDKPVFDFESRRPFDYKERIQLDDGDVAVVEGIHALNPIIYQALPPEGIIKAYISVDQRIQNKGKDVLTSREIRLLRRLVRDYRFRSTSAETTLSMWAGVCRGEDLYLTPYAMDCDVKINSVHIYEPCVIGKDALKLLKDVSNDSEHYEFAQQMISKISLFEFIDDVLVPHRSLLREFIGDGYYN